MIEKTAIITTVLERLKNLTIGHYLDLRTYKRNRSVIIVKQSEDDLLVIENGYSYEEFSLNKAKLKKVLKNLLKKEFPRSRKVRLYTMDKYSPEVVKVNMRKVI